MDHAPSETRSVPTTSRPTGVTIVGVLAIVSGILRLFGPLLIFGVLATGSAVGESMADRLGAWAILFAVVSGLTGLVLLVTGTGLLQLKPWAWTLTVVFAVIALASALAEFTVSLGGDWNWYALASAVFPAALLYYLMRPAVAQTFGKS